jgi:hypothetical protein
MIQGTTVIGVGGGFVLVGYRQERRFLAHYDFSTRSCTIHRVVDVVPLVSWVYYRDLHAIAGRPLEPGQPVVAVDLARAGPEAATNSRATRAAERALAEVSPFPFFARRMGRSAGDRWIDLNCRALRLDSDSGALHFQHESGAEKSLTPLTDGYRALKGGHLVRADRGGDVLAVLVAGSILPGLYFISVSTTAVIGVFPAGDDSVLETFVLSRDGRMFARMHGERQVEVRDVPGDRPPVLVTPREVEGRSP